MKTNAQTFNLWGNSEKSTNAYILVYDKIVKENVELSYNSQEQKLEVERLLNIKLPEIKNLEEKKEEGKNESDIVEEKKN